MAVTTTSAYNDLDHIFFYDASESTYSADLAGSAAFDYFPDDAAVGDYILFSNDDGVFTSGGPALQKIRFNVGTQLAATSITVVWEYYDYDTAWTTMPAISDGTDAFQNAGTNYVTWEIPIKDGRYGSLARTAINSITRYWMRCRITAVDTITEGGANTTDKVAHWYGKATVTSGTATFKDIYDQMVTDGWTEYVTKGAGNEAFEFMCHIEVNSGATLADINRSIVFQVGFNFKINSGGTLTLGETSESRGYHGCNVMFGFLGRGSSDNAYAGTVNFYGCHLSWRGRRGSVRFNSTVTLRDCFLYASEEFYIGGATLYACKFQNDYTSFTLSFVTATPTASDITCLKNVSLQFQRTDVVVDGLTLMADAQSRIYYYDDFTLRNSTLPSGYTFYNRDTAVEAATIQYSLDLKVVDSTGTGIDAATVAIVDKDGVAVSGSPFTTDANGDITQTYITYQIASGAGAGTITPITYSPHTLTISKSGYNTKRVVITMDRKREEIETLYVEPSSTNWLALEVAKGVYQQV